MKAWDIVVTVTHDLGLRQDKFVITAHGPADGCLTDAFDLAARAIFQRLTPEGRGSLVSIGVELDDVREEPDRPVVPID